MFKRFLPLTTGILLLVSLVGAATDVAAVESAVVVPDPVLEWIAVANDTILAAHTSPPVAGRQMAVIAASMFDAVNGIEGHYNPIHVTGKPRGSVSAPAAAIQAAYASLIKTYSSPAQVASLTARRDASLAVLASGGGSSASSIQAGVVWGQAVADQMADWRSSDGFTPPAPPFLGVLGIVGKPAAIGAWRPTPFGNGAPGAPGANYELATTTPWVLTRPSQFRPPLMPALTSAEYAADYNEVKTMGALTGSLRSSDQSDLALFWAGATPLYWNRAALQLAPSRALTLSQNARLFARLNLAMFDTFIACWDAKYRYVTWRPIDAIRGGDLDGNDGTQVDAAWRPWFDVVPTGTPAIPEYPSGHSAVSGAAGFVLAAAFGDNTPFSLTSEILPGTQRVYASFSAAVADVNDARVFAGIHFRTACVRANALGQTVAQFVLQNAARSKDGEGDNEQ